jgi:peptidyl-prolyl cis-trans isomerase SurA
MKILVCAISLLACINSNAQQLFTVGNNVVTKADFMQNYLRNGNNTKGDKKAALKENLDLFIKYKLKVQAAYDSKLDTLENQKQDVENFKQQIEQRYLTEDKTMKLLTKEAFQRMQQDIRVSHIIVLIEKSGDTTIAYKKITEAYKKLQTGANFEEVATKYSDDPTVAQNKGDLGYITAFTMPYYFETLVYNTAHLKTSTIYKSNFAYHIVKRTAQRAPLGKMQAAQILIQVTPDATAQQKETSKLLIEDIYKKLQNGDNIENLARTYSNDVYSATAGGVLQDFSVGKYNAVFENTYANLKNGEFSKPFETAFGWHILKRLSNTVPSKVLDATTEQEIIAKINNDSRKNKAEEIFAKALLKTLNYKPGLYNKANLYSDTELKQNNKNAQVTTKETEILHTFNTSAKITVGDFWKFAQDAKVTPAYSKLTTAQLLDAYTNLTAKEFYKNNLESYNPAFKAQVKEFKDGNLLFEIMERNIWNKSANDEEGLKAFYKNNKNKYVWASSADAIIFNSNNLSALNAVYDSIEKGAINWQNLMLKYEQNVRADSARYEFASIPVADRTKFQPNLKTTIFSPNSDSNYLFSYIINVYNEGEVKNYDDAKGLIINDYQTKLEDEWITSLRKKYNVKINEAVWNSILKNTK